MASAMPLRTTQAASASRVAAIRPGGRALTVKAPRNPHAPAAAFPGRQPTRPYDAADEEGSRLPALSPRERQIVRLVAEGHVNKTIGAVLDISPWTVATHLRRIFAKLGVASRASMIATVYGSGDRVVELE